MAENKEEQENQETTKQEPEKTYNGAYVKGVLDRANTQWEKKYKELETQFTSLKTQYEEKVGKELSAEEKLQQTQEEFRKLLEKERKEKQALLEQQRSARIDNELMRVAQKTTRPELVTQLLKSKVVYNAESNTVHGVGEFDSPISLDEMLSKFLTSYPEFAPAPPSGSGTKPNNTTTTPNMHDSPPRDLNDLLDRIGNAARNGHLG